MGQQFESVVSSHVGWGLADLEGLPLFHLATQPPVTSLSSCMWQWQDFKCVRGDVWTLGAFAGDWVVSLLLHSIGQSKSHNQPRPTGWGSRFHPKYYHHAVSSDSVFLVGQGTYLCSLHGWWYQHLIWSHKTVSHLAMWPWSVT